MANTIPRTIAVLGAALAAAAFATAQTPALLRDVNAGPPPEPSSWPGGFHEFGGFVYFEAATPTTGRELFRTDGTAAGTALFREFTPGIGDSRIYDMCTVGARLFFGARDPAHGEELWITDGTPAGTRLVRDIRPGLSSSMPDHLTALGGVLFFVADDGVHGKEPWITDGTTGGTRLLVDAFAGSTESGAEPLGVVGGRLVFRTYNGADPLWVTDGTPAGTAPIPTPLTGVRYARAALGGALLFAGYDPVHGSELWRTDGTQAGTWRVREFVPGSGSSEPWLLGVAGGRALLTVERSGTTELWVTDGIAAGTRMVADLEPGPGAGVEFHLLASNIGDRVFFVGSTSATGRELFAVDANAASVRLVADIRPGPADSDIRQLVSCNGRLYFAADDGVHGPEPWRTDGTSPGTQMIVDLVPGGEGSDPAGFVATRQDVYFSAQEAATGRELYRTRGVANRAWLVKDVNPGPASGLHGGVARLAHLGTGNHVVFAADAGTGHGQELWSSDGTAAGTFEVGRLHAGPRGSRPFGYARLGRRILMVATDESVGQEPFQIDVVAAGGVLAVDFGRASLGVNNTYARLNPIGDPQVGSSGFAVKIANGTPNRMATVLVSPTRSETAFGPRCALYLPAGSPALPAQPLDSSGEARFDLPVPADPSFVGLDLYLQGVIVEAGGCALGVGTFTHGLWLVLND